LLKKLSILLAFLLTVAAAQDLPKGLTPAEKELMKTYVFPSSTEGVQTPPAFPVRTMAEWETLGGLIITWTSYQSILRQIVDFAQDEVPIYIICSDSNTVKNYLTQGGVPLNNLNFILAPFNSIWVRDYGPWTVYGGGVDSLLLVDWVYNRPRPSDDASPQAFANRYGAVLHETTLEPYRFVATGGNFMADGLGTGFSSKLIINENSSKTEAQINSIVSSFMGIDRYIKMDVLPYDGIHHIDMHMKLLDEETLLVGEYPPGVSDGPQIELNLQYVRNNFLSPFGRPYKIVRIPMPPDASNIYPSQGGDYRTFTNSVFVNKTVIVPTYDVRYDTTALRIYREALPGYRVIGINSNAIIPASGAIHCITKEIGVKDQIHIVHDRLPLLQPVPGLGYPVKAYAKSKLPVTRSLLYYTTDTLAGWNSVPLQNITGDSVIGYIPEMTPGRDVFYYFSIATQNRTVTRPITAPTGFFRFFTDVPLPVELSDFDLFTQNGEVVVTWTTSSEVNNRGFEVERKLEGSEYWSVIGFVQGAGTSTAMKNYRFSDKLPGTGTISYRLKQYDNDGTVKMFNAASVDVEEFGYELYQNYPNPVNASVNSTVVYFTLRDDSYAALTLYNAIGEEVMKPVSSILGKGIHKVEIPTRELTAGVYFYRLETIPQGNGMKNTLIRKMIVTK